MTSPPSRRRTVASLALVIASGTLIVVAAARVVDVVPPPDDPAVEVSPSASLPATPAASGSAEAWAKQDDDELPSCSVPDRGVGPYGAWQTLPIGRMRVPTPLDDEVDVLVHFHGGDAASRVLAPEALGLVIVAVDAGIGSQAYVEAFAGAEPIEDLLGTLGAALSPTRIRHLLLSSWSAGYGAIREILREHPTVPSALVLLDSVHTSYLGDDNALDPAGLAPFVSFAKRAAAGESVMVLTHSEIRPPGYASTSEVASSLIAELGGSRSYAGLVATHGVEAKTSFADGELTVRGYTGSDQNAHCAHIRMLGDIVRDDVLPKLPASAP
jgi:hypothetical protein